MSNVVHLRNCPSWCERHYDPDEPDGENLHFAEDETMRVAEDANPRRVGLARSDNLIAGQPHTSIVVDLGDGGHEMTVSQAAELARLILTQVARAIEE
ncbi:DUF6907 domain-containing protein [Nocardia sp. CA-128927]|uniref:DUF6907 domain-containing protein n=1 Tax=Nocardia sp. CA-128927 TaxID=3239975 RepID=UPI003D96E8E0